MYYPGCNCRATFVLMTTVPSETLNDKYLRLFGIPLSVVVLLLAQMPFFFPRRWDLFWKYTVISVFFTGLMWEIARWVLIRVRRKFPDLDQTRQRIGWMFLLFAIQLGIGQALITQAVVALGLASVTSFSFFQIWLINFASSLFFIVVISSTYEAIYFFNQYKIAFLKSEHLKKQQAQQQIDTLKNRVNPHFLFNSLTTLSALIGEDPHRAEQFVDELSKVYRYLLKAGRQATVLLSEEFQFAASYTFLLKSRFEEGAFSFVNHCLGGSKSPYPNDSSDKIVPLLTLQYALDFLVRTQNTPLDIEVEILEGKLRISCKDQQKSRAFDTLSADWEQLERNGAERELRLGRFEVLIPIASNTAS